MFRTLINFENVKIIKVILKENDTGFEKLDGILELIFLT